MTNKNLVSLLCAAVLTAWSASPSAAQAVLQHCDKPLADAEAMTQRVAACADGLAKASVKLRHEVTQKEEGPAGPRPPATPPAIAKAAMTEPLLGRLIAYHSYSAYSTGDLGRCAPLAVIKRDAECRSAATELMSMPQMVGTPAEFVAACTKTMGAAQSLEEGMRPQDEKAARTADSERVNRCCALFAENRGRPDACAKAVPSCIPDLSSCQAYFSAFAGNAASCRSLVPETKREECLGQAAFVQAYKAKDIGRCGASIRCRALMGQSKQVVSELEAGLQNPTGRWFLNGEWKAFVAKKAAAAPKNPGELAPGKLDLGFPGFSCEQPLGSEANRKATGAVLTAAHSCLVDIELALSKIDLEVAKGIDAREEKLARLNLRLTQIFETSFNGPPKGAQGPGKPAPPAKRPQ